MATMAHRTQIGHKFRAFALMIFIALAAAACGGQSVTATPAPTPAPTVAPTTASAANTALQEIAALRRGGPGAIYVGSLEALAELGHAQSQLLACCVDARRGQVYGAIFRLDAPPTLPEHRFSQCRREA